MGSFEAKLQTVQATNVFYDDPAALLGRPEVNKLHTATFVHNTMSKSETSHPLSCVAE